MTTTTLQVSWEEQAEGCWRILSHESHGKTPMEWGEFIDRKWTLQYRFWSIVWVISTPSFTNAIVSRFFYCRCFGFYPLQTQNVAPHCPSGLAMRAVISNSEKRIDGQRKCNEVQQRQNVGPNLAKHSWIWIWVDQNCTLWFFFNIAVDNQPLEILLAGI